MSPDCAVLGRVAGRRATPAGGGWMALFFRGDARKFFLILLGRCRSEKNCAGFGRVLREFSRGVVGGGWGVGREGWAPASKWREMSRTQGAGAAAGARGPCDKGLGGETGACSPMECTAFGLVAGARCPQCRGLPAELVIAHRSIAQGFESRQVLDVHTSICSPLRRMPMLTVEIHSATSRCRQEISTPPHPSLAAALVALTVRMHRVVSRFGCRISTCPSGLAACGCAVERGANPGVDIAARGHSEPCEFRR